MAKQILFCGFFVLAFWPKPALAVMQCNPTLCPPTPTEEPEPTPTLTPTPTPILTLIPTPTPTIAFTPTPTPQINLAKLHPVILIHGLGGKPEDLASGDQNYVRLLEDAGYPEEFISTYAYADADGDPSTYDYQGDITKISADLPQYVQRLSDLSLRYEGEGTVDLVGHSLGGIVAREYLRQNPINHKIRKLITIGSPHQGVDWLKPEAFFEKIPVGGYLLRQAFLKFLNTIVWLKMGSSDQIPDLSAPAPQQLIPGSPFLGELNDVFLIKAHPHYEQIFGDIDAELLLRIFLLRFEKGLSIGDGLVSVKSASGIPVESNTDKIGFSDEAYFEVHVSNSAQDTFDLEVDLLKPDEVKFWHGQLLKQAVIQEEIISLLKGV